VAGVRAFLVEKDGDAFAAGVREVSELMPGDVTVRVAYSAVNYKDALASIPDGRVVRRYPMVPGVDLAGTVEASADPRFPAGMPVLATGYDLGVSHFGGFAERARLPGDWLLPLPAGLTLKEAMVLGTAGLTAGLALRRLEANGLRPEGGPVLVTGASGGVGSLAVAILARAGYEVAAATGRMGEEGYLRRLGAKTVLPRAELLREDRRALLPERWQGVVDSVGGPLLANVLKEVRYGGGVASIGRTGGGELPTTVFPFILRAVYLCGIDSAYCPMEERRLIWQELAGRLRPSEVPLLEAGEVGLEGLPDVLAKILRGEVRGRMLVRP
jgi:acrylyl-CoA reductase (NADPH)